MEKSLTFISALALTLLLSATALASPDVGAEFANVDGTNANAAGTRDSGTNLDEVLEHARLVDPDGITACDKYFGWSGQPKVQTEAQQILCGKYQFLYEHWGTIGFPLTMLHFVEKWFPGHAGHELERLGMYPDESPRRLSRAFEVTPAGSCVRTKRVCKLWFFCEDVCVETAPEDLYTEVVEMGEDHLPVGLVVSPQRFAGLDSAALTCAGCHLGRDSDGRYAIGLANHDLNYASLMTAPTFSFQVPLMAAMGGFLEATPDSELMNAMPSMELHPNFLFNDAGTPLPPLPFGEQFDRALADAKLGTCYYRDEARTDLITCDLGHEELGSAEDRARARALRERYERKLGSVTTDEWPSVFAELMGDSSICLRVFRRDLCDGVRKNPAFGLALAELMTGMLPTISQIATGQLAGYDLTAQDQLYRMDVGTQDPLTPPLMDDGHWAPVANRTILGLPSLERVAQDYPDQTTQGGEPSLLIGTAATQSHLEQFANDFIIIGGSTDPRYVDCDTPGLVGNLDAVPDETCRVKLESVQPLIAYLESLKPPRPLQEGPVAAADIDRGRELFEQDCATCHSGPRGMSQGTFMFSDVELEGPQEVELCPVGEYSVDYSWSEKPARSVPNGCQPQYEASYQNTLAFVEGFIGTDGTASRVLNPDPIEGGSSVLNLEDFAGVSQGVKSPNLAGVRHRSLLLHHGQLQSLEELLCMEGTRRETPAQRDAYECMYFSLESPAEEETLRAGAPVCRYEWQPLRGHEFGCDWSEDDKAAMVEYLGTL